MKALDAPGSGQLCYRGWLTTFVGQTNGEIPDHPWALPRGPPSFLDLCRMWTKPYGQSGHQLSVIGFGAMRFANPADLDASAQTVLHAHARGINYFDTAPYYCDDKSEEITGRALKTL